MKKFGIAKIASLVFVCVMLFALLAVSVSANETEESIVPSDVFEFKGYSLDELGNACFSFTLNQEAKARYEEQIGKAVDYGFVIALYEEGKSPLDAEGNTVGKAFKQSLKDYQNTSFSFKLVNFAGALAANKYVVSPYVSNGTNVYYYENGEVSEEVNGVSYDDVIFATCEFDNAAVNGEYYLGIDKVVFEDGVLTAMGSEYTYNYNVTTGMITTNDAGVYFQVLNGNIYYKGAQPLHQHNDETLTTETVDATCSANGTITTICQYCGPISEEPIPALDHDYVDGACSVCGAADPDYLGAVTIPEALAAEDGKKVVVSGTVSAINTAWSEQYNNITVTIVDADGNELYIYRLATNVALGDIITVKGAMGTHNGSRQIAQGATATINGHDSSYDYEEMTIPDAIAADDNTNVIVTGTVTKIGTAYSSSYNNISVYIKDDNGNELYLYRLSGNVTVGQVIKVKGSMATYNGARQLTGGTFEAIGTHECSNFTTATCKKLATCLVCGATTGELADHNMVDGTCTECGYVEGGAEVQKFTASQTIADLIAELGWTSSTTKQTFSLDDKVTVKINGGNNTGKAYDGDHIRIYATDSPAGTVTISVADGYELVSVKITAVTGTYAFLCVDGTTTDICNQTVDVSGSSVVLNSVKNGTNGKQVRITAIEVVYKEA